MPNQAPAPRGRSPDGFDRDDLLTLVAANLEALGYHAEYVPGTAEKHHHDDLKVNGVDVPLTAYRGKRRGGWFVARVDRPRAWIARGLEDGYRVAERVARWVHGRWGRIEQEDRERRRYVQARQESEALAARCRQLSAEAARRCHDVGLAASAAGLCYDEEAGVYVRLNGALGREVLPTVLVTKARLTDGFIRDALELQREVRRLTDALLGKHRLNEDGRTGCGTGTTATGGGS